ncbi:MAG: translocation/assembly module TamB domain-containing protein, partial [Pseudomonadales bacterium]
SDSLTLAGHEVLSLDLRVAGRGQQLAGSLRAGHWQFGSYYLGQGEVSVEGELNDGRLALAWMHPNSHLNLNVSFGYVDGVVEGSLTEGTIQIGTQSWLLESSVDYRIAPERMYLGNHCWSYESAHACVKEAGFRQGLGSLKLDLTDVPFGLESPGLAPEVDIHGQVNLHLEGTLDSTGESMLWGGRLNLDMPATVISYFDEQELVVSAAVTGEVLNNNLSARLMAQSGATNVWSVDVNVPSLPEFRQFTATTDFTTSELGIVTAFIPQLDKARGALHTAASVSTLGSEPQISLTARISEDASVVIPAAGITLSRLGLNAHTEDGDILIGLTAASGGGDLSLQGALLSPLTPSRSLKLSITGNEFLLMQRPELSIVTSPDLQIVYTDQRQLNISGKLDVVDGNFTLKDNGVQLRRQSSDVVVVSREAGSGLLQRVDINVDVGLQSFLVEMYGLKVEVDGSVRLTQRPGFPRRG